MADNMALMLLGIKDYVSKALKINMIRLKALQGYISKVQ